MEWTAEKLSEVATGYWRSQALLAGVETGIFDALPGETAEVCARAGVDERMGEMLLEALGAMGLLRRREVGGWEMVGGAVELLTARGAKSMVGALRLNSAMYGMWGGLAGAVKSGRPVTLGGGGGGGVGGQVGGHLGPDPARTRGFVMGMHSRGLALLPAVVEAMESVVDFAAGGGGGGGGGGAGRLLDVGSGAGTLGRMLCERHERLRVTLVDLPGVTEVARELTAGHPCAGRVTHLAADYTKAPLPDGNDVAVYCGALHQHSPTLGREIVGRLARAVRVGGAVVVVDLLADEDRSGPEMAMLFALNMALVSPGSYMHTVGEVRGYLEGAGVREIKAVDARGGMYRVVAGVRG